MKLIDIHTHNFPSKENLFIYCLDIEKTLNINENYFTVAIHPWKISTDWKSELSKVKEISQSPKCLGIGETGLDKLKGPSLSIQEEVFYEHIAISEELRLPLILHVVRSYERILEIHKKVQPKSTWIVHGFQSSIEIAQQLWRKEIFTSFGESLFISQKLQRIFQEAPIELCFLETDESLLPIQKIYEIAANLKNLPQETLAEKVEQNFQRIFSIHL